MRLNNFKPAISVWFQEQLISKLILCHLIHQINAAFWFTFAIHFPES